METIVNFRNTNMTFKQFNQTENPTDISQAANNLIEKGIVNAAPQQIVDEYWRIRTEI